MKEFTRRDALAGATTLGTVVLAGCVADEDDDSADANDARMERIGGDGSSGGTSEQTRTVEPETTQEPDDTIESEEIVLDYTAETTETACTAEQIGSGHAELVSQSNGTVTIEGYIVTSTPCHESRLRTVRYTDGRLILSVATASNLRSEEFCVQCLGKISYEAVISIAEGITIDSASMASADQVSGPR